MFCFFYPHYHPKMIGYIPKHLEQKTSPSFLMTLYDYDNENETEHET